MPAERWRAGDLVVDVGEQRVFRSGELISLPKLSFNFLLALIRAAPRVMTIDDLMDAVWPGVFVNVETVAQRAKLLRDALGDDPRDPQYVAVVRGRGYQLVPPAEKEEEPVPALASSEKTATAPRKSTWPAKKIGAAVVLICFAILAVPLFWPTGRPSSELKHLSLKALWLPIRFH